MRASFSGRSSTGLLSSRYNALFMLMITCAVAFIIINFIKISYLLGGSDLAGYQSGFLDWVLLPAATESLLHKPWTVLTYMIAHDGIWHMITNMLWLWVFGFILQDLTGNRDIVPIFIYGGITGAVFFLLTVNGFGVLRQQLPSIPSLQGAGASIMAVAVATTTMAPDYRIFRMLNGGIPIWVLTLIFAALDFATIAGAGAGIGMAHLGGGLIGFLYMKAMQRGHDWSSWMHNVADWVGGLFEPSREKERVASRIRQEVFYETRGQQPFKKTINVTQQRVDELLDKINNKGYNQLTDEEKDYLKRAGNEEL